MSTSPSRDLDARFCDSGRSWKGRVRAWHAELQRLPAHGVRWRWSDAVNAERDRAVSPRAAYAVRAALDRFEIAGGVEFEVSEELESYLADRHGVELTGEALLSDNQATLPVTVAGGETGADGACGDAGREASDG